MNVYVSFGDFTPKVAEIVRLEHKVIGADNTLNSVQAVANQNQGIPPDVLLTNGTVMSGVKDNKINKGLALLKALGDIRFRWPNTKIVLLLPEDVSPELISSVVNFGIYNVYTKNKLQKEDILGCIKQDKTIADVGTPIVPVFAQESLKTIGLADEKGPKETKALMNPLAALSKLSLEPKTSQMLSGLIESSKNVLRQVMSVKNLLPGNRFGQVNWVIVVWSPAGTFKAVTALNLAVSGVKLGMKTALINFDLVFPELDAWFGVSQTSMNGGREKDAGIMSFGENLKPELLSNLIRQIKWGIDYLPGGNKLGHIGVPNFGNDPVTLFKDVISVVKEKHNLTVIDGGRDIQLPMTYAALCEADTIIIPVINAYEGITIEQQYKEIQRVGINNPAIELLMVPEGLPKPRQICQKRIELHLDLQSWYGSNYQIGNYKKEWENTISKVVAKKPV